MHPIHPFFSSPPPILNMEEEGVPYSQIFNPLPISHPLHASLQQEGEGNSETKPINLDSHDIHLDEMKSPKPTPLNLNHVYLSVEQTIWIDAQLCKVESWKNSQDTKYIEYAKGTRLEFLEEDLSVHWFLLLTELMVVLSCHEWTITHRCICQEISITCKIQCGCFPCPTTIQQTKYIKHTIYIRPPVLKQTYKSDKEKNELRIRLQQIILNNRKIERSKMDKYNETICC